VKEKKEARGKSTRWVGTCRADGAEPRKNKICSGKRRHTRGKKGDTEKKGDSVLVSHVTRAIIPTSINAVDLEDRPKLHSVRFAASERGTVRQEEN